jgi:uncharacterized protein (DUF1800 family)
MSVIKGTIGKNVKRTRERLGDDDTIDEVKKLAPAIREAAGSGLFSGSEDWTKRGLEDPSKFDRIGSEAEAAGFLQKATLGPTYAEIQALTALGSKRAWVLSELQKPTSRSFAARVYVDQAITDTALFDRGAETERGWLTAFVEEPALRMKCLNSLTKLFVISIAGTFQDPGRWAAWMSWLDRLNNHVFGNWRDLIESITYSPHMSLMLTYYANKKASGERQPDENYAREIMQLFSIGLWELNMDGSYKLDADGQPIPTYTNDDIRQFARCLTGLTRWNFTAPFEMYDLKTVSGDARFISAIGSGDYDDMMHDPELRLSHYLPEYEYGEKVALNGQLNVPEGTDPVKCLSMMHDALFNHPNTAPFFALRMIQHMVTSNPSPAYVSRVAHAFADNGSGVRGDMKAVWMAILTDPEASSDGRFNPSFGRVRDGFDVFVNHIRSFERRGNTGFVSPADDGAISTYNGDFGPTAFRTQPSIFSAYDPLHIPPDFEGSGELAPEMQMWSDVLLLRCMNRLITLINNAEPRDTPAGNTMRSTYSMLPLTGTAAELVERVNLLMCGGKMSPGLRADLVAHATSVGTATATLQEDRATGVILMTSNSPDYFVQL